MQLPSEAQWESAARGGRHGSRFPWGDELEPDGRHLMNVFQSTFPTNDSAADGWAGTCPVRSLPANDVGLYEMTGNVWEWCGDWFSPHAYLAGAGRDARGPTVGTRRVMLGGSYLCHDSYCRRYTVSARTSNTRDSSAGNVGFRVAAIATVDGATGRGVS